MDFDAVGVVVVDHLGDGVELVLDVHDLALPGNGLHEMGLCLQLLVQLILILVETEDYGFGRAFRGWRSLVAHAEDHIEELEVRNGGNKQLFYEACAERR